jgi:hypothetical protein
MKYLLVLSDKAKHEKDIMINYKISKPKLSPQHFLTKTKKYPQVSFGRCYISNV